MHLTLARAVTKLRRPKIASRLSFLTYAGLASFDRRYGGIFQNYLLIFVVGFLPLASPFPAEAILENMYEEFTFSFIFQVSLINESERSSSPDSIGEKKGRVCPALPDPILTRVTIPKVDLRIKWISALGLLLL